MITFQELQNNKEVITLIQEADKYLSALGYTNHGLDHVTTVSTRARMVAEKIGLSREEVELIGIAAFLHDIGNVTGRENHSLAGSILAFHLLNRFDVPMTELCRIVTAIASHDEYQGDITDSISAVLIIADKSDVRKTRVREKIMSDFDIHDRVNFAVQFSELIVIEASKEIWLNLSIDAQASPVMDYFEIFLNRMLLCKKASKKLNYTFRLKINDSILY
jgi:hypothetical protein